jgi:hypothetical protein
MKIGDIVRVRGYRATARVVKILIFPDGTGKQVWHVCLLDRSLRAHRRSSRNWLASELIVVFEAIA